MEKFCNTRNLPFVATSVIALALAGPCFAQACDPNPDPTAPDLTNVVPEATGAGGSQSLGSGSNINGPTVSGVGISECYAKSHLPWATMETLRKPGGDAPPISPPRAGASPSQSSN